MAHRIDITSGRARILAGDELIAETDDALARGVFGAPSFFVGDELFWGNDRLETAIDWACAARLA
jgi:2-hydroxychromene-2-carboxylate isomerase